MKKLSLPVTILLASLVIGGFYYASQVSKQRSIERQQQKELEAKAEQDEREYAIKQKSACLGIYESESKKWNNVSEWNYDSFGDSCEITYREANPKPDSQCESELNEYKATLEGKVVPPSVFVAYLHCVDGTFSKTF